MIDVQELKSKAMKYLEESGPTIPVRIAKELKIDPIWASAILSELLNQQNVKFTSMKVGSTPIYYLVGQEKQLEKFADEHLKGIPKEAYLKLKENKFLEDKTQDPQTRVALRSLKDFATMFHRGGEIFWKYAFVSDNEIRELLEENTDDKQGEEKLTEKAETIEETQEDSAQNEKIQVETKKEEEPAQKEVEDIFEKSDSEENKESLLDLVKEKLEKSNIKLIEETDVKKREFTGLGRMQGVLGETEIESSHYRQGEQTRI
jgi:hypothetical protein